MLSETTGVVAATGDSNISDVISKKSAKLTPNWLDYQYQGLVDSSGFD